MEHKIYREYFQKSAAFLYPLLGFNQHEDFIFTETYLQLNDDPINYNLIVSYSNAKSNKYEFFKKNRILVNDYLLDYIHTEDEDFFIFDFSYKKDDYKAFLEGKYSKFSDYSKLQIKLFFGAKTGTWTMMNAFLEPEKFYFLYSLALNVDQKLLKSVGELCDKPNFNNEKLILNINDNKPKNAISEINLV